MYGRSGDPDELNHAGGAENRVDVYCLVIVHNAEENTALDEHRRYSSTI